MAQKVLILGATGRIGQHSAAAFSRAGWDVARFDRKKGDMARAARGCDVIVNGLNPQNYQDWANAVPKMTKDVIAAARHSGATVIVPGNVYHFGDQGGIWSEKTAPRPVSRKGQIRLDMERTYARSGVQTIVLRAGNFIDPNRQGCVMSAVYLRAIERGRVTLPGPAETHQAMCYLPDWARVAVALASKRGTLGQFEDIPFAGHTLSAAEMKAQLEHLIGQELKYTSVPWWIFRLAAPVWEFAREMNEMRYLWRTDHALSDARLRALLPEFESTPLRDVMYASLPDNIRAAVRLDRLRTA